MCIASADSLTVNQGHCQSSAVARVEKTHFAGLVTPLLPHNPLQQHGQHARGVLHHAPGTLQHTYLPCGHSQEGVMANSHGAAWPGHW